MSCELRKKVPQPHRAPYGAERGRLMATTNTTTCTTTSRPNKVTNAQMMRIATNILAAMPEDALGKLCGEFRPADVVSKARAHLATLEKSAKSSAGTPSKARLENEGLAKRLVEWWETEGETAYRAGELANTLSDNGALGMAKVSTQKIVGVLNVAVDLGLVARTFDGKSGWFFSLATSEDETPTED